RQRAHRAARGDARLLPRGAGYAYHRLPRQRRRVAAHQRRPPRHGAGRQDPGALPPLRARPDRLGHAARGLRPPRPTRPLAGLGPRPPRPRTEPLRVRPHPPGTLLRRALLRHGDPRPPPHTTRMARRPTRLQPLGHPAPTLLLPLRLRSHRIRTTPTRSTRHTTPPTHV